MMYLRIISLLQLHFAYLFLCMVFLWSPFPAYSQTDSNIGDSVPTLRYGLQDTTYAEIYQLKFPVIEITTIDSIAPTYDLHNDLLPVNKNYVEGEIVVWIGGDTVYQSTPYVKGESGIKIRIRGNASARWQEQKPYKIKLQQKIDFFQLLNGTIGGEEKEYVLLLANFKPVVGFELGRMLQVEWTPRYQFVNMVLNGVYAGFYLLTESVKRGDTRCDIKKNGFIIENDLYGDFEPVRFTTQRQTFGKYTFKYPDQDTLSTDYVKQVKNYMDNVEEAIYTRCEVDDLVDYESFAKWELTHDLLGTSDYQGSNIYLYRKSFDPTQPMAKKLKIGPAWDFDGIYSTNNEWANIHTTYFLGAGSLCLNYKKRFVETYQRNYDKIRQQLDEWVPRLKDTFSVVADDMARSVSLTRKRFSRCLISTMESNLWNLDYWLSRRLPWMDDVVAQMTTHCEENSGVYDALQKTGNDREEEIQVKLVRDGKEFFLYMSGLERETDIRVEVCNVLGIRKTEIKCKAYNGLVLLGEFDRGVYFLHCSIGDMVDGIEYAFKAVVW